MTSPTEHEVTFRNAHEDRVKIFGTDKYWCGNLPTVKGLRWAFGEYRNDGRGPDYFPSPVHHLAAGLAAAHYQDSGHGVQIDNITKTWEDAGEKLARLQNDMDRTVATLIEKPKSTAILYNTTFGAFVSDLARMWVRTTPPPYAIGYCDGRATQPRKHFEALMEPNGPYSILVNNLKDRRVRLPSTDTPDNT